MKYLKKLFQINRKKEIPSFSKPQSTDGLTICNFKLEELKKKMETSLGNTEDLKIEEVNIGNNEALLMYMESLVDSNLMKETLFTTLNKNVESSPPISDVDGLEKLCKERFSGSGYEFIKTIDELISNILIGKVIIIFEGIPCSVTLSYISSEDRAISEPTTQTVIRGPKDAFVESVNTNLSLIRKRIINRNLRFEKFTIGNETNTSVYMAYMYSIANDKIVEEVRRRLKKINVSAIFESSNIEEMIADKTITPFPLALNTERPDVVAGHLMEGKIVILVNGTPFALIVPAVLVDFFNTSEDYYQHYMMSSFIRFIRYVSFMLGLLTPALYVGILTFHHELLPTTLLLSVIAQRQGVPFPAVVEVLIMEITFEILREAAVRMPRVVGPTVSIVGALVIGQAAAEAGFISNIMVIIVAITAIANFVSPTYSFANAARLLRFLLILTSSIIGLYGVLLVLVFMVAHLSSLRSFGVPYLAPVAPFLVEEQKDVFFRFPFKTMSKRPSYLSPANTSKQNKMHSQSPPSKKEGKEE